MQTLAVIGDSHGGTLCCAGNVSYINGGPTLMHTIGDINKPWIVDLPRNLIASGELSRDWKWCFCFGEIDIRCHVHKQVYTFNRQEDEVINTLVTKYIDRLLTVHNDIAVMSVVPPINLEDPGFNKINENLQYPFVGTSQDRNRYTKKLNMLLRMRCEKEKILYIDIYNVYRDEYGFLPKKYTDDNVHIQNKSLAAEYLHQLNLI